MDDTRKRLVELPTELAKAIDDAVASGEYADAAAAIGGAVQEWKERRENWGYTIAELRALVQEGIDSGPAEPFTMDDIKAEARRLRARNAAE